MQHLTLQKQTDMKHIFLFTLCLLGIATTSCEDKDRLEEIKTELKGEKKTKKKKEDKVSFSAPAQNQAPAPPPPAESMGDVSMESGDMYPDYEADSEYNSDMGGDY